MKSLVLSFVFALTLGSVSAHANVSQNFRTKMMASGSEILQGNWNLFSIEDCKFAIAKMGMCFGNNPAAPYVVPTVPLWPDEYVDPLMKDLFGPTQGKSWWTHRLDEREALVIMGTMPPPGGYFGLQSYAFSRQGVIDTNDEIYKTMPDPFIKSILFATTPNPSRTYVFSSLGDGPNNVTIERESGASWGEQRYFIITADAVMEQKVTEALMNAGVKNRNQIFSQRVSASQVRLGLGSGADDFITLIRYAMPFDEMSGNRWRQSVPLAVFRVRDTDVARPTQPYPMPVREVRTARSELSLQPDLDNLVGAVKQKWGQPSAEAVGFQSLRLWVDLLGENCIKRPMNCLGDNSDADYQVGKTATIDAGEVIAAVGTLGTATRNANYVSLSVNWLPPLVGVLNRSNTDLLGTATEFGGTVANVEKFYVQYFSRNCTGIQNCSVITEAMVPRGDAMKVIQRNYVVPGTARGADPTQVLNPVLITLQPRSGG